MQPHLALPELSLGEPSFFPTLSAYASAPIVGGNDVEVLLNGEDIFPAVLEAIYRSARDGRPVTLPRVARTDALAGPPPPIGASPDLRVPVPDHRQAS